MEINFKLFGFTDIINENEITVVCTENTTLKQALHNLIKVCGEDFGQQLLKDDSHLRDYVRCVVADRVVDRLDEKLEGKPTIYILHEIAGGKDVLN